MNISTRYRVSVGRRGRHARQPITARSGRRRLRSHCADRRRRHGASVSRDGQEAETPGRDQDPAALGTSAGHAYPSLSPTITTPALTRAGIIVGTAAYMAPEACAIFLRQSAVEIQLLPSASACRRGHVLRWRRRRAAHIAATIAASAQPPDIGVRIPHLRHRPASPRSLAGRGRDTACEAGERRP